MVELTWKSTLLLAVVSGLLVWILERKLGKVLGAVAAPVTAVATKAAAADPLGTGTVWDTLQNALEVPVGGSTDAVRRWLAGAK